MNKKLIFIFLITTIFFFNTDVKALECLYETYDGKTQVALSQYYTENLGGLSKDYMAGGSVIASDNDNFLVGTMVFMENQTDFNNDWGKIDTCPTHMTIKKDSTILRGYTCNKLNDCHELSGIDSPNDSYLHLSLMEPYGGATPNYVQLNTMRCTYRKQKYKDELLEGGAVVYNYSDTFSFLISMDEKNTNYSLWRRYTKLYENTVKNTDINSRSILEPIFNQNYYDSFTPRVFWQDSLNYFECPEYISIITDSSEGFLYSVKDIYITYEDVVESPDPNILDNIKYTFTALFGGTYDTIKYEVFVLAENASYIDYETTYAQSGMCNYTMKDLVCDKESDPNCNPKTYMTLSQYKFSDGTSQYQWIPNNTYINVTPQDNSNYDYPNIIGKDMCKYAPIIYTNCIGSSDTCEVSSEYKEGYTELVPDVYTNTQDIDDAKYALRMYNGFEFKKLTCDLSDKLKLYTTTSKLNTLPKLVYYNAFGNEKKEYSINNLSCEKWNVVTGYDCSTDACKTSLGYIVEKQVLEIKNYCNEIYSRYMDNVSIASYEARKEECMSFNKFYNEMVEKGIINDLSSGCEFITNDLGEKLIFVLDLLKIAGPIIAIGLGTLDFIKAIASGDSDKAMKTAFKRFTTRVVAAILLFIIPIILAFLMDTFIGNQDGYDPENPFCNVVKWED